MWEEKNAEEANDRRERFRKVKRKELRDDGMMRRKGIGR